MDLSFLNNVFPTQNDPHAAEKNLNIGLLGLSMMMPQNQQNSVGLLSALSNYHPDPTAPQPSADPTGMPTSDPVHQQIPSAQTLSVLPTDKQMMLSELQKQAAVAYPGNPTMQQVAITQAIQESGLMSHPSQLAMQDNNLFGIKQAGTAGMDYLPTQEFTNDAMHTQQAGFGKNKSVADSFLQHRNLLEHNARYQQVMNAQTPNQAFNALQTAGYATDPHYANELSRVYNQYVAPIYN